jgi:murein DD-endopeptidase MepM/ murein hydrolase activator NlpD
MEPTPGFGWKTRAFAVGISATAIAVGAGAGTALGGGGGVGAPAPPAIKDATCVASCLDLRVVAEGGTVALTGNSLGSVETVRMPGADAIPAKVKDEGTVEFNVPKGTETGVPIATDANGNRLRAPVEIEVRDAAAVTNVGQARVNRAEATPAKSYYAGKDRTSVSYTFEADEPTDIRIDVTRKDKVVDSFVKKNQEPFTEQDAAWKGLTERGRIAPNGAYAFEVTPLSGGNGSTAEFEYYDHHFPLPAKHSYGDGIGAGRNHQGQDVFAKCGKPVVAARGGKVQTVQYHSAAGYYVVIDGRKTGVDYAYMHLSRKGRPKLGEKVKTGERIGFNDETGNASGCHLHYEMWSAPGWYEGGSPIDPTKSLKKWDKWS